MFLFARGNAWYLSQKFAVEKKACLFICMAVYTLNALTESRSAYGALWIFKGE